MTSHKWLFVVNQGATFVAHRVQTVKWPHITIILILPGDGNHVIISQYYISTVCFLYCVVDIYITSSHPGTGQMASFVENI